MDPMGLVIAAVGLFSITGAACDWEWFMNSRKARFLVTILSRSGARIFYALLGLGLTVLGLLIAFGVIEKGA